MTQDDSRKRNAWLQASPTLVEHIRIDCDGQLIDWYEYGQLSAFGWEIDHAVPKMFGGLNTASNLRARHWRGNRSAGGMLADLFDAN